MDLCGCKGMNMCVFLSRFGG